MVVYRIGLCPIGAHGARPLEVGARRRYLTTSAPHAGLLDLTADDVSEEFHDTARCVAIEEGDTLMRVEGSNRSELGFYYPGQYWHDADWIKNLVLFFDGVAMLIPKYMADEASFDDYPIVSALKKHGLFTVVRPETAVSATETKRLCKALADIIETGRLDHLVREGREDPRSTHFGSLSMSRLGYDGDPKLAEAIFQELKERGLARDSEDGVSIPMHRTVRTLILVLLGQILKGAAKDARLCP